MELGLYKIMEKFPWMYRPIHFRSITHVPGQISQRTKICTLKKSQYINISKTLLMLPLWEKTKGIKQKNRLFPLIHYVPF